MKKIPKTMATMLLAISMLITMTSCTTNRIVETDTKKSTEQTIWVKPTENVKETSSKLKGEPTKVTAETLETQAKAADDSFATIVSFGDALCHSPVFNAAYNQKTGDYDFSPMFKYVKKYFKNSK